MCGFAGLTFAAPFEPDPALRARLRAMTAAIRHRGPDAETLHTADFAAAGFRRLSIIDLHTGDQPVANADGSIQVFFNGEIYNHRALRDELRQATGRDLRGGSDAVVLPHLYELHGPDFVHRLNGMFAICVLDARDRSVRLYRDRLGIKPVFWAATPHGAVFGSELPALFASGLVHAGLDPRHVLPFVERLYVPGEATLARGVHKLLPGHELVLAPDQPPRTRRWYHLHRAQPEPGDLPRDRGEPAALERLDALLADAVRLQLVADVPVGISLSGGLDSSLIAHYAKGADVHAFTVAFPDTDPGELAAAELVARTMGLPHVVATAQPGDFLQELDRFAAHNDEPVADPAFYPALLVARAAAGHVKVLLAGSGADELFAGYGHHTRSPRARLYSALAPVLGDRLAAGVLRLRAGPERRAALRQYRRTRLPFHAVATGHLPQAQWRHWHDAMHPWAELAATFAEAEGMDGRNRQLYVDTATYLPHQLLSLLDRTTMAASIEGRVPFLDHRVAELAFALPGALKYRGRHGNKWLLRRLARRHLPAAVATRRKHGFPSSVRQWLAPDRLGEIRDRLLAADGACRQVVPARWLEGLLADAASLQQNAITVHTLLVLQAWHRAVVAGAPAPRGAPTGTAGRP